MALTTSGMRGTVLPGLPVPPKNFPSELPCSSVVGGYHDISAGLPSKKSGTKTRYGLLESLIARMSAPCNIWSEKPKMSYTTRIAFLAEGGPVTSSISQTCSGTAVRKSLGELTCLESAHCFVRSLLVVAFRYHGWDCATRGRWFERHCAFLASRLSECLLVRVDVTTQKLRNSTQDMPMFIKRS